MNTSRPVIPLPVVLLLTIPSFLFAEGIPCPVEVFTDGQRFEVRYTATFSANALSFGELCGYDTVSLEDADYLNRPGQPMLPVQTLRIALPPGMAATGIEVIATDSVDIAGQHNIFPAQPPRRVSEPPSAGGFLPPNTAAYASTQAYPRALAQLLGQTDLAGQGMVLVRFHPVRYVPAEKKLRLATSITVVVHGVPGYVPGDYLPAVLPGDRRDLYAERIRDLVVNPLDVELQTDPQSRMTPRDLPGGGPYDHVIICSSSDTSYWQTLADWHTRRGLRDIVVTTDFIYSNYSGAADFTKIRNFVIDAHSTWGCVYFLLGGENSAVPFKNRTYAGLSIPSDQYYGDYDDDWIYEVYVGRVSATGSAKINCFIDKLLTYEKNPPLTNYPLDITLLGMDLTTEFEPPYYLLTRGEDLKELIDSYIPGYFTVTKVYDTDSTDHRTAFLNALNDGQNLVNHCDHGSTNVMCTGDRRHGSYIDNGDVDDLTNDSRLSVVFSLGCYCNALDYADSISERFVIYNSLQAAVAFTGNTRNGWFYLGDPDGLSGRLDRYWWRALFSYDQYRVGEALAHTKQYCPYSDDVEKFCQWTLNLLGEPEMPIWTDTPDSLTVTHDATLPVGSSAFDVHVQDGGGDAVGALVCLWKGDEVYLTDTTNSSGYAYFTPSPATAGTMYVTVTKRNCLPYEGSADVIAAGPYTLTVYTVGQGDVDLDPPGGTYSSGTWVEFTADADAGWHFDHWEDDLTGSDNPDTILMDDDKTVTAHFVEHGCPNAGASGDYCLTDIYPNNDDGVWSYADDGDCQVDLSDLVQLLAKYGLTTGATREDGDVYPPQVGDGAVNIQDLSELLAQYGDDCN